jgi:hypothetical protein
MVWLVTVLAILAAVLILPPLLAYLPRGKSGGGGLGPALSELNAIFNPAERHVQEARQQTPAERENDEPKD